MIFILEF